MTKNNYSVLEGGTDEAVVHAPEAMLASETEGTSFVASPDAANQVPANAAA